MKSLTSREKDAQTYVEEAKEVYRLLQQEKEYKATSPTPPNKLDYFYVISNAWFEAFKTKTSFRSLEEGITISDINLQITLPTMNEDLIDRERSKEITKVGELLPKFAWLDIVLKNGLRVNIEYILVNEKLWKYLKSCYPESVEIKRPRYLNHLHEECAEIYLIPVIYNKIRLASISTPRTSSETR
jgi:hypothetical protein